MNTITKINLSNLKKCNQIWADMSPLARASFARAQYAKENVKKMNEKYKNCLSLFVGTSETLAPAKDLKQIKKSKLMKFNLKRKKGLKT